MKLIILIMLVVLIAAGTWAYFHFKGRVSSDDAQVDAHIVAIAPLPVFPTMRLPSADASPTSPEPRKAKLTAAFASRGVVIKSKFFNTGGAPTATPLAATPLAQFMFLSARERPGVNRQS